MQEGSQFTIQTDHRPLVTAPTKSGDAWSARQQRQLSAIAESGGTITYIPGSKNLVADALSRITMNDIQQGIDYDAFSREQHTWHNINTLCKLPELEATSGLPKQLDLVKEIWLMCLTIQVCSSLSDTDSRNIEVLVKEAEERHDAHQAAVLSHPVSQNVNLTIALQHGNEPTASTTTNNDTPTAGHFICWYHRRYGDNARKCSQGCQYQSKNCITGCA